MSTHSETWIVSLRLRVAKVDAVLPLGTAASVHNVTCDFQRPLVTAKPGTSPKSDPLLIVIPRRTRTAAATAALASLGLSTDLDAATAATLGDLQLRKQVLCCFRMTLPCGPSTCAEADWSTVIPVGSWHQAAQRHHQGFLTRPIWRLRLFMPMQAAIASEDYDEAKKLKTGIQRCSFRCSRPWNCLWLTRTCICGEPQCRLPERFGADTMMLFPSDVSAVTENYTALQRHCSGLRRNNSRTSHGAT